MARRSSGKASATRTTIKRARWIVDDLAMGDDVVPASTPVTGQRLGMPPPVRAANDIPIAIQHLEASGAAGKNSRAIGKRHRASMDAEGAACHAATSSRHVVCNPRKPAERLRQAVALSTRSKFSTLPLLTALPVLDRYPSSANT